MSYSLETSPSAEHVDRSGFVDMTTEERSGFLRMTTEQRRIFTAAMRACAAGNPTPRDVNIKCMFKMHYGTCNDYDDAIQMLQAVDWSKSNKDDHTQGMYMLGELSIKNRCLEQGIAYFRKALEVDPDHILTPLRLGASLCQQLLQAYIKQFRPPPKKLLCSNDYVPRLQELLFMANMAVRVSPAESRPQTIILQHTVSALQTIWNLPDEKKTINAIMLVIAANENDVSDDEMSAEEDIDTCMVCLYNGRNAAFVDKLCCKNKLHVKCAAIMAARDPHCVCPGCRTPLQYGLIQAVTKLFPYTLADFRADNATTTAQFELLQSRNPTQLSAPTESKLLAVDWAAIYHRTRKPGTARNWMLLATALRDMSSCYADPNQFASDMPRLVHEWA